MSGKVFLAGAGPGDPGLLTRRVEELLSNVDVIVCDALVSPEIRVLIPPQIEVIDAGKRASKHTLTQDETNSLLVKLGGSGKRVLRLKGGDPFVFGRGGEEAEALAAANIDFEIIPGISSSIAAPAYAGIPVTHRSLSTSFTVITGHESESSSGVDWPAIAAIPGTVVFLMGLSQLGRISSRLIENGKSAETPVAVIASGTTPRQRCVTATLSTIERAVAEAALEAPALIVVGDVVKMRETISWFETRPLFGRTVVVTRARQQASSLAKMFEEAGARVLQHPMIEIVDPSDWSSLDEAIASLGSYQWLVFTSLNGVEFFFKRLLESGKDARELHGLRIAAVGNPTADALRERGIRADIVPDRFQSNALLPLLDDDLSGVRFAVVRAAKGNDEFLDELRRRGASVDLAVAYETRAVATDLEELREALTQGRVDAVTFTSGSTVDNFFEQFRANELGETLLASIGPQTSAAMRRHGAHVDVEAESADVQSLFRAVADHLRNSVTTTA